jgi:homogentisate 1,2-dioxygenase
MKIVNETSLFPLRKGRITRQAHVDLPEGTFEEEFGRQGFYGRTTHLYRSHPPTAWTRIEGPLRPRSYDLNRLGPEVPEFMPGCREPAFAPVCVLRNEDVALNWVRPEAMDFYYRDASGDDVFFIHAGGGRLDTTFGFLDYERGDYLVIPRGTTYRFLPDPGPQAYLLIESAGEITLPDRNQLGAHALFDPARVDTPELGAVEGPDRSWTVHVKRGGTLTRVTYPFNPNDAVGWKGDLTVWRINVRDIRPVISPRYHLPPSAHTTFLGRNFIICSFLPRPFEEEPGAMRVPFYHANIDYDEAIFYSDGHFFSREGVGPGHVTWHPQGIHHGPHPKAIPASREKDRTDEVAVMVDTLHPLEPTPAASAVEDEGYWASWK